MTPQLRCASKTLVAENPPFTRLGRRRGCDCFVGLAPSRETLMLVSIHFVEVSAAATTRDEVFAPRILDRVGLGDDCGAATAPTQRSLSLDVVSADLLHFRICIPGRLTRPRAGRFLCSHGGCDGTVSVKFANAPFSAPVRRRQLCAVFAAPGRGAHASGTCFPSPVSDYGQRFQL